MADPVLELKARLALLAAPGRSLPEGGLTRTLGRIGKAARGQLLADLAAAGIVAVEPARRGRRVRLLERGALGLGEIRVPSRARFTGAVVNALLTHLRGAASEATPGATRELDVRGRLLAAHARLARGPGGTVDLATLRDALPGVHRRELDAALLDLDRAGDVSLGRPVDLAALDERARSAAIDDPTRGLLVFVSRTVSARSIAEESLA